MQWTVDYTPQAPAWKRVFVLWPTEVYRNGDISRFAWLQRVERLHVPTGIGTWTQYYRELGSDTPKENCGRYSRCGDTGP